eukprot:gnl/Chilomastix_cuspidata/2756.p1 GENE.gnl/Chilomastix_cuspidata/2756~~gnl/Chilomastix_cuspidata/2756.p1  ORF type:complete len:176 (-),score=50.25 gnl/Chilomastix_cuspidata/2756:9-497(-)
MTEPPSQEVSQGAQLQSEWDHRLREHLALLRSNATAFGKRDNFLTKCERDLKSIEDQVTNEESSLAHQSELLDIVSVRQDELLHSVSQLSDLLDSFTPPGGKEGRERLDGLAAQIDARLAEAEDAQMSLAARQLGASLAPPLEAPVEVLQSHLAFLRGLGVE